MPLLARCWWDRWEESCNKEFKRLVQCLKVTESFDNVGSQSRNRSLKTLVA